MKHSLLKWFMRGCMLCLAALVLVGSLALAQRSQAQGIENPNLNTPRDAPAQPGGGPATDIPLTAQGVQAAQGEPPTNEAWMAARGQESQPESQPPLPEGQVTLMAGGSYASPLTISAAEFRTDGGAPDGYYFQFAGGYLRGKDGVFACMQAPVYLPNGAHVTELWMSAVDNYNGYDLYVDLNRVSNATGGPSERMAGVNTSGYSTAVQNPGDTTISFPDVNYPYYSYFLSMCFEYQAIKLYSVRIYFK